MFAVPKYTYHFLGIPEGSRYTEEMTVQASNLQEAEGKLRRQYGADPKQCRHTGNSPADSEGGGSDFSLGDYGFKFALLGIVIVIGLILPFLPYIIGFGAIALICWGVYKLIKWIFK